MNTDTICVFMPNGKKVLDALVFSGKRIIDIFPNAERAQSWHREGASIIRQTVPIDITLTIAPNTGDGCITGGRYKWLTWEKI